MNSAFYDAVRETVFGGSLTQQQVDGIEVIETAWTIAGDGDDFKLAYLLGTAWHETGKSMQPVKETTSARNPNPTDAKVKEILTKAWKARKLPWVKKDYWSTGWFGRGLVQLTHRDNYEKAGKELGLDLVKDPSKAMIPEVAALILVRGCLEGWFTGKKLGTYINKSVQDFREARRVVNGTDRAADIAKYATSFYRAIEASRLVKPAPVTPPKPADTVPQPNSAGWIVLAAAGISAALAYGWDWIVAVTGAVSPWW